MRFIYVDEAGVSAAEPVTVVVGVVVHADNHWKVAESRIKQILDAFVPAEQRPGFIFHAKEMYSGGKQVDRRKWDLGRRIAFIKEMVALPRQLGMAIAMGMVRRDSPNLTFSPQMLKAAKLSKEQYQHMVAFWYCTGRADKYLRDHIPSEEVATIVAEDAPDMRQFLRKALEVLRLNPISLPPIALIPTKIEEATGVITQETEQKASRIVDTVHFAEKKMAFLLQLADACAFSFRRYFSLQQHGEDFVLSMLDRPLDIEEWRGESSGGLFFWHAPKPPKPPWGIVSHLY